MSTPDGKRPLNITELADLADDAATLATQCARVVAAAPNPPAVLVERVNELVDLTELLRYDLALAAGQEHPLPAITDPDTDDTEAAS